MLLFFKQMIFKVYSVSVGCELSYIKIYSYICSCNMERDTCEYMVKLVGRPMGRVDLISSYCARNDRNPLYVRADYERVTAELLSLLEQGYQVNLPGIGVATLVVDAERFEYHDSPRATKESVRDIKLKITPDDAFKEFVGRVLNQSVVE